MTDRERLLELIAQSNEVHSVDNGEFIETTVNWGEIADHLLANGVIVPPCKVGDTVYCIFVGLCERRNQDKCDCYCGGFDTACDEYNGVYEARERPFTLSMIGDVGENVFLTKEEAEQALKESEQV